MTSPDDTLETGIVEWAVQRRSGMEARQIFDTRQRGYVAIARQRGYVVARALIDVFRYLSIYRFYRCVQYVDSHPFVSRIVLSSPFLLLFHIFFDCGCPQ
ncbi:hypothetical protein AVEN_19018-1 [Araneus ventricosus]|uniref:Uncharacterized protein n=1 Tax=Araneus ventricosus TaxID=182803 RepID=A0A4Y2KJ89_ARAVE|nr:hypothetical protein AVEN_19018-1 [Araneus ventricosus]